MPPPESYRDDVVQRLRTIVESRGTSIHAIEKRLKRGRGYVADALRGDKKLSVELVVEVLETLGVEPAEFFARATPADSPNQPPEPEPRAGSVTVASLPPSLRNSSTLVQALLVVLANRGMLDLGEVEEVEREASR